MTVALNFDDTDFPISYYCSSCRSEMLEDTRAAHYTVFLHDWNTRDLNTIDQYLASLHAKLRPIILPSLATNTIDGKLYCPNCIQNVRHVTTGRNGRTQRT